MKVLLAMPMHVMLTADSIAYALQQAGCTVTVADTEREHTLRLLVKSAARHPYDFVLGCKRACLLEPFRKIREQTPHLPLLCWNMDSRPTIRVFGRELVALFSMVDIMFTTANGQIDEYRAVCSGRVVYLPQGCDPRYDNRIPPSPHEAEPSFDVFFAGDYQRTRDGRAQFFRDLRMAYGKQANVVGRGPVLIGRAHSLAVQRAKICLGWVADPQKQMRSQRDCKILGAGGFLLTRRGIGIEDYFRVGEELDVFDTADECFEKIDYYLAHPDERQRIADAGYRAAHGRDTYLHHVRTMLRTFEEWRDGSA